MHQVAHVQTGLSKSQNRSGPSVLRPYLRVANVQDGYLDLAAIKQIEVPASQVERFSLRNGDVLVTEGGDFDKLGRGSIWNGEIPDCVHQNHVFAVRVVDSAVLLPEFLACEIQSSRAKNYFLSCAKQTTNLASINSSQLKELPVIVPPIVEQRAIVNVSGAWDTNIQKTEQLIAAKERRHRGLFQRLINRQAARRHWKTFTLGELIRERSERSTQHDEHLVLTSARRGLFLQSEYFSKQVTSNDNTGYKIMRRGDFTFRSMSDDGRFVFNRLEKHDAGIISPAYSVFHADGVSPKFLAHVLNSAYSAQLLALETQGGTRKALRFSALAGMKIDLPGKLDQERIAAILDESIREIDLLGQSVAALKTQKRGLMQKLLTGQWRLKPEDSDPPTQTKEIANG